MDPQPLVTVHPETPLPPLRRDRGFSLRHRRSSLTPSATHIAQNNRPARTDSRAAIKHFLFDSTILGRGSPAVKVRMTVVRRPRHNPTPRFSTARGAGHSVDRRACRRLP